jgi:hypothetical protein
MTQSHKQKQPSIQNAPDRERGQVLVIIVLAMVALLGMVALAVDGGLVLVDRRGLQNAADAGTLAGGWQIASSLEDNPTQIITYANWSCKNSVLSAARTDGVKYAIDLVSQNNYTVDDDISDQNGVQTICYELNEGSYVDKYVEVEVNITNQTETAFAHFVFGGELINTVEAKSRVRPRAALALGYSILTYGADCGKGTIKFDTESYIRFNNPGGSGLYSYSCIEAKNSTLTRVRLANGAINYRDKFQAAVYAPSPTLQTEPLPSFTLTVETPDCSSLPNYGIVKIQNTSATLLPGVYTTIEIDDSTVKMAPGLYCIATKFKVQDASKVYGDSVTLYIQGDKFETSINEETLIQLSAPQVVTGPEDGIQGILIYMDPNNKNDVELRGIGGTGDASLDSFYKGTIYHANAEGKVIVGGDDKSTMNIYHVQIVSGSVEIKTEIDLEFVLDSSYIHQKPSNLNLVE